MKFFLLFFSLFFLFTGCGTTPDATSLHTSLSFSKEQEKGIQEKIIKPQYSLSFLGDWKEIHPSTITGYEFQQQNIQAVFSKEIASEPVFFLVTKENIPFGTTLLEFFSRTRQNIQAAIFDFSEIETRDITLSQNTAQILHFSARNTPSAPLFYYWQMPLIQGEKGIVFTVASTQTNSAIETEIQNIFSTIELR